MENPEFRIRLIHLLQFNMSLEKCMESLLPITHYLDLRDKILMILFEYFLTIRVALTCEILLDFNIRHQKRWIFLVNSTHLL